MNPSGEAVLSYAARLVERIRWSHWILLAGVQLPLLTACCWWLARNHAARDVVLPRR
jgi:hypothetical protein